MAGRWGSDPARVELLKALQEFRGEDSVDDRGRLVSACGPLWSVTDIAPMIIVAAMANVIEDMPKRKTQRTYAVLVRIIVRQLLAEEEGQTFMPHGRRRVIGGGD